MHIQMGNLHLTTAEKAKSRRYSRSSGFAHYMDNMKDKKSLKIHLRETAEDQGVFSMIYFDESMDDFFNVKSTFTYTGTYRDLKSGDAREVFGVVLPVNTRGAIELEPLKSSKADGSPGESTSAKPRTEGSTRTSAKDSKDDRERRSSKSTIRMTKFYTEKVTCKLTENNATQNWVITPSTTPDCAETSAAEIQQKVSWPWSGEDSLKVSHTAPPGVLDFIGEETFEGNGVSSIDLKIRFPQLACGHFPAAVSVNETTGWKLGKKNLMWN